MVQGKTFFYKFISRFPRLTIFLFQSIRDFSFSKSIFSPGVYWKRNQIIFEQAKTFSSYISDNLFLEKLLYGLDENSSHLVKRIIEKVKLVSSHEFIKYSLLYNPAEYKELVEMIQKYDSQIRSYNLNIEGHLRVDPVLYTQHKIAEIPNIEVYTKGKIGLDCGAYNGDSAFMFEKKLGLSKIYSFEPVSDNFELLKKNIEKNHLTEKIFPVKSGVGKVKGTQIISSNQMSSVYQDQGKGETIEITSINEFSLLDSEKVGLIKWDIEGEEFNSLQGALKIIKRDRPILLISIYHNGHDFFEIKPFIESLKLGYKFKILHCDPFSLWYDTLLVCYIDD